MGSFFLESKDEASVVAVAVLEAWRHCADVETWYPTVAPLVGRNDSSLEHFELQANFVAPLAVVRTSVETMGSSTLGYEEEPLNFEEEKVVGFRCCFVYCPMLAGLLVNRQYAMKRVVALLRQLAQLLVH